MIATEAAPDLAIGCINLQNGAQIINRVAELVFGSINIRDGLHRRHRPVVVADGLFVRGDCAVQIALQFLDRTCEDIRA